MVRGLWRLTGTYAVWALTVLVIAAVAYRFFLCGHAGDTVSAASAWVEAFSFSVQTMTTVGYGNWWPGMPPCDVGSGATALSGYEKATAGILVVKLLSIPFMLVGAFIFAITVALASALLVEWVKGWAGT